MAKVREGGEADGVEGEGTALESAERREEEGQGLEGC